MERLTNKQLILELAKRTNTDPRQIVKELTDLQAQAQHDFENVLFGDVKADPEKDTKVEQEISSAILDFMHDSTPQNKKKAYAALRYLDKFKNIFPDDLMPDTKEVYRGTAISIDQFVEYYTQGKLELNTTMGRHRFEGRFTYRPRSNIQSWTTDYNIATSFGNTTDNIRVTLFAKVNNSFILNSSINRYFSRYTGTNEDEIIRLSKRPIQCKMQIVDVRITRKVVDALYHSTNPEQVREIIASKVESERKYPGFDKWVE